MRFVNVAFVTLDSATLLYTYISRFSVNPHYISRGRKSGKAAAINFIPQPLFNFLHKRPTFDFTGEIEYTLGFRKRIAPKGLHGETGAFPPSTTGWLCRQRNCHRKNSRRKRMHASWRVSASSCTSAPLAVYLGGCSLNIRCISMTDRIDK